MKKYLKSINRKTLFLTLLTSAFILTTSVAFAALTLNTDSVVSDGTLTLTGSNYAVNTSGAITSSSLAGSGTKCLHTDNSGLISVSTADCGSGTVTSLSITTANGVSGSVATATTTPAITLDLGAITPTSVNSVVISGSSSPTLAVTGTSSISGTNTGDQTNITGKSATTDALNSATTIIDIVSATAPINGQVLTATSGTAATWQTPSGGSSIITSTFLLCAGPCTVNETSNWKWSAPADATITSCVIDAQTYPTGAAITVDVLKGGTTSIFSSTVPTLSAGSSAYNEQTGMSAAATLSKGDFLTAKVLTIGSSVAGQYVNVICKVTI